MKILKFFNLIIATAIMISCSEHEIEYKTDDLSSNMAEIQIHYVVPVAVATANNIYEVDLNDQLVANEKSPLSTYNAIPNGSVGRFYSIAPGSVNIKLYKSTALNLVYDKNVTLTSGKQNVFVYDFDKEPIVFDNEYPYEKVDITALGTDSVCYVKFYNFLYEDEQTPTTLKLQYQYVDTRTGDSINIGKPVAFGETTGWQPVKVVKSVYNSSGYRSIYYAIKVIDAAGKDTGNLQYMNSSGSYRKYSDYWNGYIGRRYHHVLRGTRAKASPSSAVSQFTAL